jgi:hypothetical protein
MEYQSGERSFSHAVDTRARKCRADGGTATNEDNPATVFHGSGRGLKANEGGANVNGDHTIEIFKGVAIDRSPGENAGIAHEDVERAESFGCLGHSCAEFISRGTIGS